MLTEIPQLRATPRPRMRVQERLRLRGRKSCRSRRLHHLWLHFDQHRRMWLSNLRRRWRIVLRTRLIPMAMAVGSRCGAGLPMELPMSGQSWEVKGPHCLSLVEFLPNRPQMLQKFYLKVEVWSSDALMVDTERRNRKVEEKDQVRVKRKTLEAVLGQCQRALELLSNADRIDDDNENIDDKDGSEMEDDSSPDASSSLPGDLETDELCDLLKSRVECHDFIEKLECARLSVRENVAEECSWDVVSENDIWEGENANLNEDDYVVVRQEDILDDIACFMAAYLLSLKQTKDETLLASWRNQLDRDTETLKMKANLSHLRNATFYTRLCKQTSQGGTFCVGLDQLVEYLCAFPEVFG